MLIFLFNLRKFFLLFLPGKISVVVHFCLPLYCLCINIGLCHNLVLTIKWRKFGPFVPRGELGPFVPRGVGCGVRLFVAYFVFKRGLRSLGGRFYRLSPP